MSETSFLNFLRFTGNRDEKKGRLTKSAPPNLIDPALDSIDNATRSLSDILNAERPAPKPCSKRVRDEKGPSSQTSPNVFQRLVLGLSKPSIADQIIALGTLFESLLRFRHLQGRDASQFNPGLKSLIEMEFDQERPNIFSTNLKQLHRARIVRNRTLHNQLGSGPLRTAPTLAPGIRFCWVRWIFCIAIKTSDLRERLPPFRFRG